MPKLNGKLAKRHNARVIAVQSLYSWQLNRCDYRDLLKDFSETTDLKYESEYLGELLKEVTQNHESFDKIIQPLLQGRGVEEVTPVEHAVLWVAVYELKSRIDIPYRVVINEALEINKELGTDQGYQLVNAILEKVAHQYREVECGQVQRDVE